MKIDTLRKSYWWLATLVLITSYSGCHNLPPAREYLQQNRTEAAHIMARREQLSPTEFLAALDGLRLPDQQENQRLLGGEQQLLTSLRRLVNVMHESGLLQKTVDPTKLLGDWFVRKEQP